MKYTMLLLVLVGCASETVQEPESENYVGQFRAEVMAVDQTYREELGHQELDMLQLFLQRLPDARVRELCAGQRSCNDASVLPVLVTIQDRDSFQEVALPSESTSEVAQLEIARAVTAYNGDGPEVAARVYAASRLLVY